MTQSDKDRLAAYDKWAIEAKRVRSKTHWQGTDEACAVIQGVADLAPTPTPDWSRVSTEHVELPIGLRDDQGNIVEFIAVEPGGDWLIVKLESGELEYREREDVEFTTPIHPYWLGEDGVRGGISAQSPDGHIAKWLSFPNAPEGCKQTILVVTE